MNLTESVKELIKVLKDSESSDEQIDNSISIYYDIIKKIDDDQEVGKSMKFLTELFSLEDLKSGSIASLICGSLVEHGFPARFIIEDYIDFFELGIKKSLPLIKACEEELQKRSNEDEDKFDVIDRKKEELRFQPQFAEAIQALEGLDSYYSCGFAIFSSGLDAFEKGKSRLSTLSEFSIYSETFHWLSKLFEVLYNEPIIVIDLNTKKGFKGRISGIVDNFQLQILLMGVPELNEEITIPKQYLDIVKGFDVQQVKKNIPGKWNMCNWEYLKYNQNDSSSGSQYWIWSEGTPAHISKFNHNRIILLDTTSYIRHLPIQRTFKSLKAEIQVDEVFKKEQIQELLQEMKNN